MEKYTKEEFESALRNYQNANSQLEEIAEQIEQAENEGQKFDVRTIEDEGIRPLVTEVLKIQRGETTEENLVVKMLEQYFEFDRFTNENWKSFVSDYNITHMLYDYIDYFNENTQLTILNAMLENGYADLSKFSKKTIKAEFNNAIEAKNKNIVDALLYYDIDKETILDQYEEIEKIYSEDKEGLSKIYNRIRDEIAQKRPELIEQTLMELKGTSYANIPWMDASAKVQNDNKDLLPEIISMSPNNATSIWKKTDDSVKKAKFKEIFESAKNGGYRNELPSLWIASSDEIQEYNSDLLPSIIQLERRNYYGVEKIWKGTSEELRKNEYSNILKTFHDDPHTICAIWSGLKENVQIQEKTLYKIIEMANGNIGQIINLWADTNEQTQTNNGIQIYNYAKNLKESTNRDMARLLKVTSSESLTKIYDNLTNEELGQLFYDMCNQLGQGTNEDIEKLNIFLKKYNSNIDAEKIIDLLTMQDAKYLAKQIFTNIPRDNAKLKAEIDRIYQIFFTNELPEVYKLHQFFLLHSHNHTQVNWNLYTERTPIEERDKIMLGDLFLTALESNNKQMKDFIEVLHNGDIIYEKKKNGENSSELDEAIMLRYRDVLYDLFNYKSSEKLDKTNDVLGDIENLKNKLQLDDSVKIGNRLLDDFIEEVGLQFEENIVADGSTTGYLLAYMDTRLQEAFQRNTQPINVKTLLGEGDLIKGTHITFLPGQLRNGIRSKEFNMVGELYSDGTPFDTDFSEIKKKNLDGKTNIMEIINSTFTKTEYGNTYLVVGKDDYDKERSYANDEVGTRYIRTAEGSTSIKAIITSEWDEKYAYSMAQEGIYIPVIDTKTEEILFTKEQYDKIREKMKGMAFYRADDFEVDKNVENEIILENARKLKEKAKNEISTEEKKAKVIEYINAVLPKTVVQDMTGDASRQNIELIDTGSTGRGTNIPGDGDFDFMLKCVDNRERVNMISIIGGKLNGKVKAGTNAYNLRYEDVIIDGLGVPVDIDVTSEKKSLAVEYSSDMCVRDRLDNIEKVYGEEKRKSVVDNIIVAKKKLKEAGLYKKVGSDKATSFGGFGDIGVENWILQNGGSFILAMETFLDSTKDKDGKDIGFEEFKKVYPIYDFGQNHREDARNDGHDHYSNGLSSQRF